MSFTTFLAVLESRRSSSQLCTRPPTATWEDERTKDDRKAEGKKDEKAKDDRMAKGKHEHNESRKTHDENTCNEPDMDEKAKDDRERKGEDEKHDGKETHDDSTTGREAENEKNSGNESAAEPSSSNISSSSSSSSTVHRAKEESAASQYCCGTLIGQTPTPASSSSWNAALRTWGNASFARSQAKTQWNALWSRGSSRYWLKTVAFA